MATPELGRLERVDPRRAWTHEELDFTPWLLAHADSLGEALGIDIEFSAAEHRVGPFELDLIGRDLTSGTTLIVENQLASTDHSHLGQLLTYAAGTSATTIVWIATAFTEPHRQAIVWLNERTDNDTQFFGVELELVRIGDSLLAPNFKLAAAPNDWQKRLREVKRSQQVSGKGALYADFWGQMVERLARERPNWTRRRELLNNSNNWLSTPAPVTGAGFSMSFARGDRLRNELYIDGGASDVNLELFRLFEERASGLDAAFGRPLSYEPLEGRGACRIADYREGSIDDSASWPSYIDWFIDSGDRFRNALGIVRIGD